MNARSLGLRLPRRTREAISRGVRRLPLLRTVDDGREAAGNTPEAIRQSAERRVERELEKLAAVFPRGLKADGEAIAYDRCHVLAMSARVGSTALLSSLQIGGLSDFHVREIFNNRGYMASLVERLDAESLCQYLNAYAELSGEGRLPFKIGWWDMAPLLGLLGDDFDAWFPNASWVYLQRRDTVAQAYSLWKGANHDVWHLRDGDDYRCPVDGDIPLERIRELRTLIELENESWNRFFETRGIEPTRICYEDFAEAPEAVTRAAYRGFTGEDMSGRFECPIAKSSDETDRRNVERLRRQLAA